MHNKKNKMNPIMPMMINKMNKNNRMMMKKSQLGESQNHLIDLVLKIEKEDDYQISYRIYNNLGDIEEHYILLYLYFY